MGNAAIRSRRVFFVMPFNWLTPTFYANSFGSNLCNVLFCGLLLFDTIAHFKIPFLLNHCTDRTDILGARP